VVKHFKWSPAERGKRRIHKNNWRRIMSRKY